MDGQLDTIITRLYESSGQVGLCTAAGTSAEHADGGDVACLMKRL